MPEAAASDDAACRPNSGDFLNDTNACVSPPAMSGCVMRDNGMNCTKYPGAISYGVYDSRAYMTANGYVSFDLAGFPDSAAVIAARLWYYQYEHGALLDPNPPYTSVVLIPDVNAPAEQLLYDIFEGIVVDPIEYTDDGWVVRSFNSVGLAAVDSCVLTDGSIDIGICGGGCAHGAAYGAGPYHPLRAYLEMQYATDASYCDVVAVAAYFEALPLAVGDSVVVVGRFTNTGNKTAYNVPVIASCTGTTSDTVIIDSLASDDTTDVRTALPPATAPGTASLVVCSYAQGDWCCNNDTAVATTYMYRTKQAEGFESPPFPPVGWTVHNGGDTSTWQRAGPTDRYAHTGQYYARCARTDRTEDWLITYGLKPDSSSPDTVYAFFSTPSSWCYPQVWALGSQNQNDVRALLLDTVITTQGWYEKHIGLDQFDGQTVYVGFRTYAGAGGPLCLDDICFASARTPAVEEPRPAQTSNLRLWFSQNPTTGGRVVVLYQIPKPGPLLFEIADALGRTVAQQRLPAAPGTGRVCFSASSWPTGTYFCRVKAGAASASARCVVNRRSR